MAAEMIDGPRLGRTRLAFPDRIHSPNRGRLYLEWGEALFYKGRKDEARKQFAQAETLDLSAPDKIVLRNWMTTHG